MSLQWYPTIEVIDFDSSPEHLFSISALSLSADEQISRVLLHESPIHLASTMAAHLAHGFELVILIRQLMKDQTPETQTKILSTCKSLETFVTTEVEKLEKTEAIAEYTECQARFEKLSQYYNKYRNSFLLIKRTHDTHSSYIASLSRRILALNQEDSHSRIGPDECHQFERLYLIYQLSIATTDLLAIRKKYMKAKERLQKIETRLKRVDKICEEQDTALERVGDEWKRLGVESDAVLADVAMWWEGVTGEEFPL